MKQTLLSPLVAATIATGLAAPAAAEMKYENASGGSTLFYGQFDPTYQSFDDGVSSYGNLADNTNSNSRVGVWIRQPSASGAFSFNFETALGLRPSAGMSQGFKPDAINWQRTSIRKIDFAWKSDRWGKFSIGQGSMASDGAANVDLSGTTLVLYNGIGDTAGLYRFRDSTGALTTRTMAAAFPGFDGGRRGRIRYDTPSFNGFSVSAAYGEEILATAVDLNSTNIALRYAGEAAGFKLRGAVAYSEIELGTSIKRHDTIGSFSALHDSGINVTLAAGDRRESGNYLYAKIGYRANWFAAGETAIAVDLYDGNDLTVAGSDSRSWGVGAVQKFDKPNIEAYAAYRSYELNEPATSYRDASSILIGARWRF